MPIFDDISMLTARVEGYQITQKIRQIVVLYYQRIVSMHRRERALRQIKNIQSCGCRLTGVNKENNDLFLGGSNFRPEMEGHQHLQKRVSAMARPRKSLKVHRQGKENGQVIRNCLTAKEKVIELKMCNTNIDKKKVFPQNGGNHRNQVAFNFTIGQNYPNGTVSALNYRPFVQNRMQSDNTPSKMGQKHMKNDEGQQNSTIYTARNEYRRWDNGKSRLNKIQSSQNLLIPQFSSFKNSDSNKASYFSQFGHQKEGSSSKVTHKLSDLNFKCTESVKDSSSPAISEIISDSDSSFSEKASEDAPVRLKDLKMRKAKLAEPNSRN